MAEPRIIYGRVILMTLVFLLLAGAYYGIRHFSDAPAEVSEENIPVENVVQSTSAESEDRLEERQSDTNPNSTTPAEVGSAFGFFGPEAGLTAFQLPELYAKYVDEANDGNLDAQYVLVTVLQECRHGPTTTDEIAKLERSGLSHDVLQAVKDRFQRCEPLYRALPNLEKEYQQRYKAVREAKHPLVLVKQRKIPVDEKRQLVIAAISQDYPEPYLYASAYLEAAALYREYPEQLDILREEAWLMLYCRVSFHCDSRKELEHLRTEKYHAYELDEIAAIYSSIAAAIDRRGWDALGI